MNRRAALVSLALASLAASAFAAAPANSFNLVSAAGKNVGNASYNITKDKNGYHIVGKFQYKLGSSAQADTNTSSDARMGSTVVFNEGQYYEDFKVSEEGSFLSGYTQNASNQVMTSFQPNKAGNQVTVNQIQGGINLGSRDFPLPKPGFIVVPDFDPASMQVFLTTALAHPHDDKTYLFLVPAGPSGHGKDASLYVILQLSPETLAGTLDGKPVKVTHFVLNYHVGKADLYTDDTNTLMQADMGPLGVSYVRAKFALSK